MNFLQKTALPLVAALAFTFTAASAQPKEGASQTGSAMQGPGQRRPHSPQEMAQHQTKKLSEKLNLTADQSARVQQIFQQRAQDMQALQAQVPAGTDRQQLHEQAKAGRAKYDLQLKGVLTPEQFGKYTAMQAERRHHGRPDDRDGKFKAKDGDRKVKAKTSQG